MLMAEKVFNTLWLNKNLMQRLVEKMSKVSFRIIKTGSLSNDEESIHQTLVLFLYRESIHLLMESCSMAS